MSWVGSNGRMPSFFWYDLETSGTRPKWDRIEQFAAMRTDSDLQEVGETTCFYVKLPMDVLPDPEACLITGLVPNDINQQGLEEISALDEINRQFSTPQTCVAGYNSLRFDDEFIRYAFYRNFLDPYAREWQNRNSRWDLIDLVRATAALRPEGIDWPIEDGGASFRLEKLAVANNLEHSHAHDALSDVRATIQLARLVKQKQPRLFDYYLSLRNKRTVLDLLQPLGEQIFVHVSGMYPRGRSAMAPVMSICAHPKDSNSIIVLDLQSRIELLATCSVERIRELLFTHHDEDRPGLKELRINRCPFVAPLSVLRAEDQNRLGIDIGLMEEMRRTVQKIPGLSEKIQRVYQQREFASETDVETQLYEGGFLNSPDKVACAEVWRRVRQNLDPSHIYFDDPRMSRLLLHLRARRDYASLNSEEKNVWHNYVRDKLEQIGGALSLADFEDRVRQISAQVRSKNERLLVEKLIKHGTQVRHWLAALPDS